MRLLLDAGAAVDAIDDFGLGAVFYAAKRVLLEPVKILGEADCALHAFPGRYGMASLYSASESLLEHTMSIESWSAHDDYRYEASKDEAEAVVDAVIRLVAQRRRVLGALVRTSLDPQHVSRLQLSPDTVLDHKASIAVSMLHEKIGIPESLKGLSPYRSTVYHIPCLNLRHAHALWNAGFRDIDELDSLGRSSLMSRFASFTVYDSYFEKLEVVEWLVQKGADLYRRQSHAFQRRMSADRGYCVENIYETDRASSATALHYLAAGWGRAFHYKVMTKERKQRLLHQIRALTEKAKRIVRTILTDPLPDCCNCACSIEGCSAYTMMVKYPVMVESYDSHYSIAHARKGAYI